MPSLLLVVFVFQLALYAINSISSSNLTELLWLLYNRFPTSFSQDVKASNMLRYEVLRLKKEMSAVSAQDDFARWAKLRRQHDRAVATYEKSSSAIQAHKATFTTTATTLRFLLLNGLRFLLQWWFQRTPMFWIPAGWVPGYVEWILCFPRAPIGSISIQMWGIACGSMLALVGEAVGAVWRLATGNGQPAKQPGEKMAVPAGDSGGSNARDTKKEL